MAIPSQNAVAVVGPNLGTGGAYVSGPGDAQEPAWVGVATFTGDGSLFASNANFIDGTNAIPFIPSYVRCSRVGGNDTNNGVPFPTVGALNNVAVTVNWTVAPASGKTQVTLIELYK